VRIRRLLLPEQKGGAIYADFFILFAFFFTNIHKNKGISVFSYSKQEKYQNLFFKTLKGTRKS
jgi:hypothetical protein